MNARPRASELRKYFIDPPDASVLEGAKAAVVEAEKELVNAQNELTSANSMGVPPVVVGDPPPQEAKHVKLFILSAALLVAMVLVIAIAETYPRLSLLAPFLPMCFIGALVLGIRGFVVRHEQELKWRGAVAHAQWQAHATQAGWHQRLLEVRSAAERAVAAASYKRDQAHLALQQAVKEYERQLSLAEPKPSDDTMEQVLQGDIAAIKERALRRLSLHPGDLVRPAYLIPFDELCEAPENSNEPNDPFVVYGPAYGAGYPVWCALGEPGRDGRRKRRYSRYKVMVICTTRYHLALYWCILDFFTGKWDEESTAEYHYSDVVAVHSKTDPDSSSRIKLENHRSSQQGLEVPPNAERYFEVVVSSGDRARIVTGFTSKRRADDELSHGGGYQSFEVLGRDPNFDAVADAVRMMLREKKGAIGGPEPRL